MNKHQLTTPGYLEIVPVETFLLMMDLARCSALSQVRYPFMKMERWICVEFTALSLQLILSSSSSPLFYNRTVHVLRSVSGSY